MNVCLPWALSSFWNGFILLEGHIFSPPSNYSYLHLPHARIYTAACCFQTDASFVRKSSSLVYFDLEMELKEKQMYFWVPKTIIFIQLFSNNWKNTNDWNSAHFSLISGLIYNNCYLWLPIRPSMPSLPIYHCDNYILPSSRTSSYFLPDHNTVSKLF